MPMVYADIRGGSSGWWLRTRVGWVKQAIF